MAAEPRRVSAMPHIALRGTRACECIRLIDSRFHSLKEAQALGLREIQGHKTLGYRYTVVGQGETSRVQAWVSQETGLPARFEEEFENDLVKQNVSWDVTYDSSLAVEPPVLAPAGRPMTVWASRLRHPPNP